MTLRVLFLDIDGVLNSQAYFEANPGAFNRSTPLGYLPLFDSVACARLEAVLRFTGAKLVISSSWRIAHSIQDLRIYLAAKGVTADVIGYTPSGGYTLHDLSLGEDPAHAVSQDLPHRGAEILAWVDAHPELDSFAVVDDNSDMDGVRDRFVQTTWEHGLLDEHLLPLARTLLRPREFTRGQIVNVYGVDVSYVQATKTYALDINVDASLDQYTLAEVVDVAPAYVNVRLINTPTTISVPVRRLSVPFPAGQRRLEVVLPASPP